MRWRVIIGNIIKIMSLLALLSTPAVADDLESVRREELGQISDELFDSIADDVYVRLYLNRLVRSRLEVTQQQAAVEYAANSLQRMQRLYEKRAASLDELQLNERNHIAAVAELNQRKARVEEMRAMFNIAVDRVSVGLDMPICSEIP